MADIILAQVEADALLAMPKERMDEIVYEYPVLGGGLRIPLVSTDKRESFMLDIIRSRVTLEKGTYQNRVRSTVILARLDFGGASHRNPDDQEIACPHLHLYREGYGDKWATPIPADFGDLTDAWQLLKDFMRYVNIITRPDIRKGLFI